MASINRRLAIVFCCFVLLAGTVEAAPLSDLAVLSWNKSQNLPLRKYGTLEIPMQLVALRATQDQPLIEIGETRASHWAGTAQQTAQPTPTAGDDLPPAPAFIIAEGTQRGEHIIVVALSPLFARNGVTMQADSISARVVGAVQVDALAPPVDASTAAISAPPADPVTTQSGAKILVSARGMQEIRGSALPNTPIAQVRLWHDSAQVPIEITDTNGDNMLNASDVVRFFAETPGDRWNTTDTYWLNGAGSGVAQRIATVSRVGGTGATRTSAMERGWWRAPTLYESRFAGSDDDHWFDATLTSSGPTTMTTSVLATVLPRLDGEATYRIRGTVGGRSATSQHVLNISTNTATAALTWSATNNWEQTVTLNQRGPQLDLRIANQAATDELLLDGIAYALPVDLRFGQRSAAFVAPLAGRYQLSELPANWAIYDITEDRSATTQPIMPQRLTVEASASSAVMLAEAGREYAVVGTNSIAQPAVQPYTPPDLRAALQAKVVYVAPSSMHAALAPLVALRESQGYAGRVALVDPQALYDTYSQGQIAPEAIRSFFRAAYATSRGELVAATLVGDGTHDPFDYSRKPGEEAANNINVIPPYLAPIDPWIIETACETCYAQLDGDSPQSDLLPDIGLGRLPVKNVDELTGLVAKIVRYETSPINLLSAGQIAYVTDNYYWPNGSGGRPTDPAGDFPAYAEESIKLQPATMQIKRLYYDPTAPQYDGIREPNARQAYERTRDMLDTGPGIVNYIGHGNYQQWAVTDLSGDPGLLFGLYSPDSMKNGDRLPIVLGLTCLTSAFQVPLFRGTSIDERLVLKPDGGAIATWGSSGAGVTHGHDALQEGFYRKLWSSPPLQATFGELTQAGYVELLVEEPVAQSSIRTYLLLGDPLTKARVAPAYHIALPFAGK